MRPLVSISAVFLLACSPSEPLAEEEAVGVETRYLEEVVGRWAETPACEGMAWTFGPDAYVTPGEMSCRIATLSEGADGAIRVGGGECSAEGMEEDDRAIDVWVDGDSITVKGVDNAVDTPDWARCP